MIIQEPHLAYRLKAMFNCRKLMLNDNNLKILNYISELQFLTKTNTTAKSQWYLSL